MCVCVYVCVCVCVCPCTCMDLVSTEKILRCINNKYANYYNIINHSSELCES